MRNVKINLFEVGDIFLTVNNINPATRFKGTWELIAKGRTLVGVDPNDTDFNTVQKTGGEKTHILNKLEVPKIDGDIRTNQWTTNGASYVSGDFIGVASQYVYSMSVHEDNVGRDRFTTVNLNYGGNQAHNNLQPYFTCYIWCRTA